MDSISMVASYSLAAFVIGVFAGRLTAGRSGVRSRGSAAGSGDGEPIELYVGNLPYDFTEKDMRREFEKFGAVVSTRLIKSRANGKSKGYGFVEIAGRASADAAARGMNGASIKGRKIVVNEAKSRPRGADERD